jgi:hypothetical protein
MTKIEELENVLLNQIEMLNDESLNDTPETAKIAVDKSKQISELTNSYIGLKNLELSERRLKLDAVKIAMDDNGYMYQSYLGIEEDKNPKRKIN